MLDLRIIRDNLLTIADALKKRGKETHLERLDDLVDADEKRRTFLAQVEEMKARRNKVSKEIPLLKKEGKDVAPLMEEMKELSAKIKDADAQLAQLSEVVQDHLMSIPNAPSADVPTGTDDMDNVVVREFMTPTVFDFDPKPHWDLGTELGILDPETAAKVTGTRFMFYLGAGARLERSVINFMLDTHTAEHGYTEVQPPFLANERAMIGTGQLPKFAEDMYHIENSDFYLIPTAEVPVTNMYREEILEESRLPIHHCAYTACFRAEAGSAGRDTKGLIRQHQFNKIELVKFAHPDKSYDELESLLHDAEHILQLLEIPYRVVLLCGGDLGFSSAKTYDIEVWMPSYNRYVEISSCSNFEDFQARRANIRFRDSDGRPRFVHTLNGSGLAVGRTVAAIMENYQQADGSIRIPKALQAYFRADVITR